VIVNTHATANLNLNLCKRIGTTRFGLRQGYNDNMAWLNSLVFIALLATSLLAQELAGSPSSVIVPIEFPLSASNEVRLIESLERLAGSSDGIDRPTVILEFTPNRSLSNLQEPVVLGRGTSFERGLVLARWLSGPKGARVRSVAFLPQSICGHAVLIALGCEEIAIASTAEIGQAGIDEPTTDGSIRQAYLDIAARRSSFPPAAVLSLLDPSESLVRIDLAGGGVDYATAPELEKNVRAEQAWNEKQLVPNNQMAKFLGQELRTWKWVAHIAENREQLSNALRLSAPVTEQSLFQGARVAVRTHIKGIVSSRQVNRAIRAIEEGLARKDVNLILIELDSAGGSFEESLRLANFLAEIPADRAEVVCFVSGDALGDAALIPMACDMFLMKAKSRLGGPGEATISPKTCKANQVALEQLSRQSGRQLGALLGLVCSDIPIFEYNNFDGRRQLASPEWMNDDPAVAQWTKGNRVSFEKGIDFRQANDLRLANDTAESMDDVGNRFGLDELPEEVLTNSTEQFVEWLAGQGWLSMFLLMVGIISLSAELSTPGVGVGGAIAAVCFLLFFWIHMFQGTVEWLEILLIVGGIVCLGIELFVLPGFGVFGVTGIGLLGVGLLLAGQTFVLPTNEYQWQRTATTMGQMGLMVLAFIAMAILFRKQLANLPMVRWFALEPPVEDKELIAREENTESLRTYIGWKGTTVSRCNPTGKATIGDRIFSVTSQDAWIDEDSAVEVVDLQNSILIVRRA
jgi:membrane-bound serine protease (ClpP class)